MEAGKHLTSCRIVKYQHLFSVAYYHSVGHAVNDGAKLALFRHEFKHSPATFGFQPIALANKAHPLQGAIRQTQQVVRSKGFGDKVVSPALGGLHRGFNGGICRYHDKNGFRHQRLTLEQELKTADTRHAQVHQDQIYIRLLLQKFKSFFTVFGHQDDVALGTQHPFTPAPDAGFIIHHKNFMAFSLHRSDPFKPFIPPHLTSPHQGERNYRLSSRASGNGNSKMMSSHS